MATFSELLRRSLGNDDVSSWLQLRAWSQSLIFTHTPSDVIPQVPGVAMTTIRDVTAATEKDKRFMPTTPGKCLYL